VLNAEKERGLQMVCGALNIPAPCMPLVLKASVPATQVIKVTSHTRTVMLLALVNFAGKVSQASMVAVASRLPVQKVPQAIHFALAMTVTRERSSLITPTLRTWEHVSAARKVTGR
jgi:hypothetical protein